MDSDIKSRPTLPISVSRKPNRLASLLVVPLLAGVGAVFITPEPAHAVFLEGIITFANANFQGAQDAVKISVNAIRLICMYFFVIGLIPALNALRQGEEWQILARQPLAVVVIVGVSDVVIKLLTGN
jgi:hypothetical protein